MKMNGEPFVFYRGFTFSTAAKMLCWPGFAYIRT